MKLPAQVGRTQPHYPERWFGLTEPIQASPTSSSWALPTESSLPGTDPQASLPTPRWPLASQPHRAVVFHTVLPKV